MPDPTSAPIPMCSECGGAMQPGWLMDQVQGGRTAVLWIEGKLEKSMWLGAKISGRAIYVTETLRCDGCGALRSYARTRKR